MTGHSMSPILNAEYDSDSQLPSSRQDNVLVRKYILFDVNALRKRARGEEPETLQRKRGDIVTFYAPHSPNKVAVKRIVGIPGDRIQPLPGYPGGDEPVIVPWNHVWVEGDADSRQKSIDSNWYGPISQNLIIGEVRLILSPWWSPRWVNSKTSSWPARENGRVEENVVLEASVNPDSLAQDAAWENGTNAKILQRLRDDPEILLKRFNTDGRMRKEVRDFYRNAALVVAVGNPDSDKHELASDIISAMDELYGRKVLMEGMIKKGKEKQKPLEAVPQSNPKTTSNDRDAAREAELVLRNQGWSIDRDAEGKVIARLPHVK